MSKPKQKKTTNPKQEAIDELVISQADDDSAWAPRIHVKRSKATRSGGSSQSKKELAS